MNTNNTIQQVIQQDAEAYCEKNLQPSWNDPVAVEHTEIWKSWQQESIDLFTAGVNAAIANPSRYGIQGLSMEQVKAIAVAFANHFYPVNKTPEDFDRWSQSHKGKSLLEGIKEPWISVSDRLPGKDGYYLAYEQNTGRPCVEVYLFRSYNKSWYWGADCFHPTHWQPLPSPPINK